MSEVELTPAAAALLAPGGAYEVRTTQIGDAQFPLFVQAPPNLQQLYRSALAHGDQDFYVFGEERFTFKQAWQYSQQVAQALQAIGVGPGDRVGIALRNYPEWIWAFMGITSLGAVAVCMNAWWTADEMKYGIEDSGLNTLFVDEERQHRLRETQLTQDIQVVCIRCNPDLPNSQTWQDFLSRSEATASDWLYPVEAEDMATILYTSGSTAHPKGVVATHRSIIHALLGWEAAAALALAQLPEPPPASPYQPAMILAVPLFHVTGLNVQFLSSFRNARKLVGMYKWDPEQALALIERERITMFNGVPTMSYELVRSPNYDKYDLSSLRSMGGGGAAMAPEHSKQINQRSAQQVAPGTGYGMTETNGLGTSVSGEALLARPRTAGAPLPPVVTIKIVDDQGAEVPRGETGEIWIHGPMNFKEYWQRPEATAETLTDGWVHTGDIGHMDEENYVFITDRQKDMVIRGGENIGCQEVEAAILDHPDIEECTVFGVPDSRLGEALATVVQRVSGSSLTELDVRNHVARQLAKFKIPEHIWIQDEQLPRIASGKIYKRGIREQQIQTLQREQASG